MLRRGMAGLVLAIITASPASAVEVGRLRGHLEFLASEALAALLNLKQCCANVRAFEIRILASSIEKQLVLDAFMQI